MVGDTFGSRLLCCSPLSCGSCSTYSRQSAVVCILKTPKWKRGLLSSILTEFHIRFEVICIKLELTQFVLSSGFFFILKPKKDCFFVNKFRTISFLVLHFPLLSYSPLLRNIHLFSSWTESLSPLWSLSFILCCLFVVIFISLFSPLFAHFETAVSAPHAGVSPLTPIAVIWSLVRPLKRKRRGCVGVAVLWVLPHFCHHAGMVWRLWVSQLLDTKSPSISTSHLRSFWSSKYESAWGLNPGQAPAMLQVALSYNEELNARINPK